MTSITSQPITDGQEKQIKRLAEDGVDSYLANQATDTDQGQRLIERGDEFQNGIHELIQRISAGNQFTDEETESSYGYLSGYRIPEKVTDQIARLGSLFPELNGITANNELATSPLNPLADKGVFAIPDWHLLAPTYPEAVQRVLDTIEKTRGSLYNYRKGQIDAQHLRESQRSEKAWAAIREAQADHGILIIQAQFGLRHRGRSVRRALEVMTGSEFGLGAYTVGIMLLTHEIRLKHYDDLWLDCPGDEFSDGGGEVFDKAPYFFFDGDGVEFDTGDVSNANDNYGSVSAFLPQ